MARTPCRVCTDGSCMLCDDDGMVPEGAVRLELFDTEEDRWQSCGEFPNGEAADEERVELIRAGVDAEFRTVAI